MKIKYYIRYKCDYEPDVYLLKTGGVPIDFDTYEEAWNFINSPYNETKCELVKVYWDEYQNNNKFYIEATHDKTIPTYMVKMSKNINELYSIVYKRTGYGSYVDISEYGMAQQKNAMSLKELIKYNYIPIEFIEKKELDRLEKY